MLIFWSCFKVSTTRPPWHAFFFFSSLFSYQSDSLLYLIQYLMRQICLNFKIIWCTLDIISIYKEMKNILKSKVSWIRWPIRRFQLCSRWWSELGRNSSSSTTSSNAGNYKEAFIRFVLYFSYFTCQNKDSPLYSVQWSSNPGYKLSCRVQAVTLETTKTGSGWRGWDEDKKILRKLIFLSRITGWSLVFF